MTKNRKNAKRTSDYARKCFVAMTNHFSRSAEIMQELAAVAGEIGRKTPAFEPGEGKNYAERFEMGFDQLVAEKEGIEREMAKLLGRNVTSTPRRAK